MKTKIAYVKWLAEFNRLLKMLQFRLIFSVWTFFIPEYQTWNGFPLLPHGTPNGQFDSFSRGARASFALRVPCRKVVCAPLVRCCEIPFAAMDRTMKTACESTGGAESALNARISGPEEQASPFSKGSFQSRQMISNLKKIFIIPIDALSVIYTCLYYWKIKGSWQWIETIPWMESVL